ncbi:CFI-box-CTERM domain-containing protein [Paraburkholderia nodosa]|uniref:CFI-box-CTERM domain-containing protein n=1 Tax=Paraburkholderia nodosa TaxID=392320 RepID=UPI0012B68838|nr:CFI-box-CTERM domain-containing protein [Paraburkholderia nodosa]
MVAPLTAICPNCQTINPLPACNNDGGTAFRFGPLANGAEGWICVQCNLGHSHYNCISCDRLIPASSFTNPGREMARGILEGKAAYQGGPIKSSGGSNCFIATELYGRESSEVRTLRQFRDRFLIPRPIGKLFVAAYYRTSPSIVLAIRRSTALRYIFHIVVSAIVHIARRL